MVLCVGQASLPVSYCGCFVAGALRRSHTEGQQPPNPNWWTSRSRRTSHLDRPPGRPCRESPGLFVLSLAFLGVQQTVGRQSTRATPWIARRLALFSPRARVSTPYQTPALRASRPPLVVLRPSLKASLTPRGLKTRTPNSAGVLCPLLPLMHAGKNGARKPCTANSALGVARSVVSGFAKEPQNPHTGSKLRVPEQPLITRPEHRKSLT